MASGSAGNRWQIFIREVGLGVGQCTRLMNAQGDLHEQARLGNTVLQVTAHWDTWAAGY